MIARLPIVAVLLILIVVPARAQVDLISVRDTGAKGDGKADDTQAFQDAVAAGRQQGKHVYVPRGQYRLSRTVELDNIGIMGPVAGAWPADIDALPSILPAQSTGPVFRLGAGASLRGLDITYPGGAAENAPPTVLVSGIGVYISNCRIRYSWDGILTDGKSNVGRLNIENVFMVSPRNVGVRVTGTWDVPALRNVEVWNAGPVPRGLDKGIGILLGKNDLVRLTDCFVFGMRYGFVLADEIEGCEIKGGTWGTMSNCATDYCGTGVEVRGANTVSISGGTFWDHAESLVVDGKEARVRVTGAELKSNGAPAVVVRACDHVVIQGCSVLRPMASFKAPAVVFSGGRLVLSGNHIEAAGPGVEIGASVAGAVVNGNIIATGAFPGIVRKAEGQANVVVEGNVLEGTGSGR